MPSDQEEKDSREHTEHENANNLARLKHLKDVVLAPNGGYARVSQEQE